MSLGMTIDGKIIHPLHPDRVLKLEQEETPYICNGCGELGFNSRYTCEEKTCNFHLHKNCATPEEIITHPFFPGCFFHFLQSGEPNRICDACGRDIKGFVYHCFDEGWDLHPSCANLQHVMELGEVKLVLHQELSSKCYRCRKKKLKKGAQSWSYVSTCKKWHFHVACAKEMLPDKLEKENPGDGKREVKAETGDSLALKCTAPKLQIVLQKKRSKFRKFAKFKKIAKIAITFIMAAVVGDPTALVAALIASLIAH